MRQSVPNHDAGIAGFGPASFASLAASGAAPVRAWLDASARLQVEAIALTDIVDDAVGMAESRAKRGDVKVDVNVPVTLPPLQGDPHQFRQLFTNLLVNAFEALSGAGTVRITASALDEDIVRGGDQPEPMIQICIADDGPGVPPEVVDRIFSPFFTTKPQGSGLGLAIVRKIVDAHDGRIDVSSRAGAGTTFRVTVPVKTQQALFG